MEEDSEYVLGPPPGELNETGRDLFLTNGRNRAKRGLLVSCPRWNPELRLTRYAARLSLQVSIEQTAAADTSSDVGAAPPDPGQSSLLLPTR